ncbi:NAD(P)/FAD-dependent oxidoreductase [Pseudonocardia sp. TMWB2A]|uniref:NAD(P)/FAD-dependent oxidoreductase n=1 Tax=Pseudonocardia sp. TMWB2A TaxID=687430 RepID=UPI00307D6762
MDKDHSPETSALALTETRDLRSGDVAWTPLAAFAREPDPLPDKADIVVIGAGIMGATLGERLSAAGHDVLFLDRHPPATSSTAASTAQVMWGMDMPLTTLAARIGEEAAAQRWRDVYAAVQGFSDYIDALGINCGKADIPTLYLNGNKLDAAGLAAEAASQQRHGLPVRFEAAEAVAARFGITPRPGTVSDGGFEVDPVRLALGLVDTARARGAKLCFPHDVTALAADADGVTLTLAQGTIRARHVVLASGYERPLFYLPPAFSLLSTFVIATPPDFAEAHEQVMIWEAADPYLYVRTTGDGRIVAGGEDSDQQRARVRDSQIAEKSGTILAKLAALLERDDLVVDKSWAATFGTSPDTLPALGPAKGGAGRVWLSYGFGGNGIAFAALAADLLPRALAGEPVPELARYDPYRFS